MASPPFTGRIVGADPQLWRELRVEATRRNVPTGVVWNEIMREWHERRAASQTPPQPQEEKTTAASP